MTELMSLPRLVPRKTYGNPQLHTDAEVMALAFDRDGALWTVEESGMLRHWSIPSGQLLDWQALSDMEMLWCFSHDPRFLASATNDVTLWDISSGQVLAALPKLDWVSALGFHPDPTVIAVGHADGVVRLWDLESKELLHTLRRHRAEISSVAFSRDGTRLAVACEDRTISIWNAGTGTFVGVLSGHTDRIPQVLWHPSGRWLVSIGWDTTARVWDTERMDVLILLNSHAAQVNAAAFSGDGELLACADSDWNIHVWDFAARKTIQVLRGPRSEIRCLAFSPDGRRLAANGERTIHVWNPRTGEALTGSGPRGGAATTLALSRNRSYLASNGGGAAPRLWHLNADHAIPLEAASTVYQLAFSPDEQRLVGAMGTHIRWWEIGTGQTLVDCQGPSHVIDRLALSQDGSLLATASSRGTDVWLWRVSDNEPVLVIPDALDGCSIEALAFHPDGQRLAVGGIDHLATGGSDGMIALWNVPGRFEEAICENAATVLAIHPSGTHLAFAMLESNIGIWDFASQQLVDEILGHEARVSALAYSPDGRWLASADEDNVLRLWDENGHEIAGLEVDSQITGLTFAPDGQHLYTSNANSTCSLINVSDILTKKS